MPQGPHRSCAQPQQVMAPIQMPYGFYPSPNQMFIPPPMAFPAQQTWPPPLAPYGSQPILQPNVAAIPQKAVKGPSIGDWL